MNHERDKPSEGEEVAARATYALALGRPGTDQQSRALFRTVRKLSPT